MTLQERIKNTIREVPDFPKPGIRFKDITPLLKDSKLSEDITVELANHWSKFNPDVIVGIESRGFLWGHSLAQYLKIPFVMVRKKGKLPSDTYSHQYDLEYGTAEVEIHKDDIKEGQKVIIHDDLLATGGTAKAAAELIGLSGGKVAGFSFLVELSFLSGRESLTPFASEVHSLVTF